MADLIPGYTASGLPVNQTFNTQGQPTSDVNGNPLATPPPVYNSYVPPTTTTPIPSSNLTTPNLNLPTGGTPDNGSSLVAGVVGGMNASQPPPASDTSVLDKATTDYNSANTDYQTDVNNAQDAGALETSAYNANGGPKAMADLQALNTQIAERTAAYNQSYQDTETRGIQAGTPAVFYQGEQAAIQRQKAVELGNLGILQAAAQGNEQLAYQRATDTANLQYKSQQDKITNAYNFLKLNEDNLTNAQSNSIKLKADAAQAALDKQKAITSSLNTIGIQAASGGAPTAVVQQAMATNDPVQAAGILATYLKGPLESVTSSGVSEGTMFKVPTTKELGGAQFYKYPDSSQVYSSAGKTVDLATYKQLTGQTNVPDAQVKFNGIKTINGTTTTPSPTGKVTTSSGKDAVLDKWSADQSIQGNGKISSTDYKAGKAWWISKGLSAANFDTTFSYLIDQSGKNWKSDYGYKGN